MLVVLERLEDFEGQQGKALDIAGDVPPPTQEYLSVHRMEWGFG